MKTRKDYLSGNISHSDYYAQFVTKEVKAVVSSRFSISELQEALKAGEHLNTIPLARWDTLAHSIHVADKLKEAGDSKTLAVCVCILKEAAKQIAQANPQFETGATSHAVNDLILFADNTRTLADLRNALYEEKCSDPEINLTRTFPSLLKRAITQYEKEFKTENSMHVLTLTPEQEREFCQLYADGFQDWKKENTRN